MVYAFYCDICDYYYYKILLLLLLLLFYFFYIFYQYYFYYYYYYQKVTPTNVPMLDVLCHIVLCVYPCVCVCVCVCVVCVCVCVCVCVWRRTLQKFKIQLLIFRKLTGIIERESDSVTPPYLHLHT